MKKAEATRLMILQKAFELIYEKGYQTTSVDDILATTQVTKGAFYYHFKNKDDMGLAIIEEILKPSMLQSFTGPLAKNSNPLDAIYELMHHLLIKNKFLKVEYGCPAANFTQEMTPWNADFRKALDVLTDTLAKKLTLLLETGKMQGLVKKSVQCNQVVGFVLAGYWGVRNMGKLANNKKAYQAWLRELKSYLNTLR